MNSPLGNVFTFSTPLIAPDPFSPPADARLNLQQFVDDIDARRRICWIFFGEDVAAKFPPRQ